MSAKLRRSEHSYSEQDNVAEEITYDQGGLAPDDVSDILDRLHIGTLRRDQLKAKRAVSSGADEPDNKMEDREMDDKELENFYRHDGAHAEKRLSRQSSRTSATSIGSTASFHSAESGDTKPSRQTNNSSTQVHRQPRTGTSTHEMGIQTTIGKSSNRCSSEHKHQHDIEHTKKERKPSTKVKKLFGRKSSSASTEADEDSLPMLPQGFVVKYMGKRATKGLWGSKHTRGVVEEVVDSIGKMSKGEDLPLVNLEVYYQGLAMRPHSKNKVRDFKPVQIPIQFISYGLQDTVYSRIFCFIMVKEMSSLTKSMECHVYACDSARSAKELAACLAIAFQAYSEKLDGGVFKFSVDLNMSIEGEDTSGYDA